ncbi:MAG: class I SAM-dependent methyltransferase [Gammaproteobacteria bacterium]|nr:class I SAM-dependent methyltransferase [Gammaproteobacteria bacterium]
MNTGRSARRDAWTRFWQTGALHSLAGSFQGNYAGAIRAFWEAAFAPLGADDRVLDIGTGNGPLPALLCELRADDMPQVDAIDLASPDPAWLASTPAGCRNRIRFHSGRAAEDTGFPEACFTLVASQYGIEYSDLKRSVTEVARITADRGRLALVVHHASSRLAQVANAEVRLIDWLGAPGGLMERAAAIYPYMAMAARGERERLAADPDAARARAAFNAAMQSLDRLAAGEAFPDALFDARGQIAARIDALIRGAMDADAAAAAHARHVDALHDARLRSQELVAHALDEAGCEDFLRSLRGSGFTDARAAPLHHDPHLVGWSILGTRIR